MILDKIDELRRLYQIYNNYSDYHKYLFFPRNKWEDPAFIEVYEIEDLLSSDLNAIGNELENDIDEKIDTLVYLIKLCRQIKNGLSKIQRKFKHEYYRPEGVGYYKALKNFQSYNK